MLKAINRATLAILAFGICALASQLHYSAGYALHDWTIWSIAAAISAIAGAAALFGAFLAFAE